MPKGKALRKVVQFLTLGNPFLFAGRKRPLKAENPKLKFQSAVGVSVFRCFGVSVFRCFGVSVKKDANAWREATDSFTPTEAPAYRPTEAPAFRAIFTVVSCHISIYVPY